MEIENLLIASITPYFLEKEVFWFEENLDKILKARNTQSFFEDNIIYLEKGQNCNLSQLLRKIDEMGYEKVFKISEPGEFSQRGGIIDIFPINLLEAVRIDFLGNELEAIKTIDGTKISDAKKIKEIIKKRLKSQKIFSDLGGLTSGDFLVHLDHGIAKFIKFETFEIPGSKPQEYYVLEYDQGDVLYVPLGLERKLSRYVGFSDPKISRLGSSLWQKTKRKIKEDVEKMAKELLLTYAQKEISERDPYSEDKELEEKLRSDFIHEETPDQIQAISDIKKDLKKERPMDRIILGDVGFGKTEVAMRAGLIAAISNRQTAIMCPTTILANQHYINFKKRFENLGVKTAIISRLQKISEQKKILKDLKDGNIDILIGTHRILSKDIKFKNLQLLIIDDEQRFGVKQKEKLRQENPSLDILSLSATPIPRTIYFALSSLKNISLIQTPPRGRHAIETNVIPYSNKLIKKALEFESKRNGQVYFLHNRIETLEKKKNEIKKLMPDAKIGTIHGRMPEIQLIKTMNDFQTGKIDVLLATTIIENGLDMPNVNTIIIEDATKLGLAQAHQIRGRVGRSDIKSFAYFMYKPDNLSGLAKERLEALKDAKELGSGYRLAIRDLELRGAGNILGKEQSGAVNKIGLNLYSQILSEAIEKMRT